MLQPSTDSGPVPGRPQGDRPAGWQVRDSSWPDLPGGRGKLSAGDCSSLRPFPARLFAPGTEADSFSWCLQSASALSYDALQGLTYLQVKGSGLANTCSVIEGGSSNLKDIKAGDYRIQKFCMEPTSFTVKEESQLKGGKPEFVKTKLTTRLTYTLDEVRRALLL